MFGTKPLERLAKVVADGAAFSGENWDKAFERVRNLFRKLSRGHQARASTEVAILSVRRSGLRQVLRKAAPPGRVSPESG